MWTLDEGAAVPVWRPRDPVPHRLLAFSTRRGGVSQAPYDTLNLGRSTDDRPEAVTENRRRLLASLGSDAERLATAGQVHGARVAEVGSAGLHPDADGLVTRVPGMVLAVSSADCLTLLLTAPGAVAAAHSGWRGTVQGMPRAVLRALCQLAGVGPDQVTVHVGPHIRPCCYEVGEEVARQFPPASVSRRDGKSHLDLLAAAGQQLLEEGVPREAIGGAPECTSCNSSWYFSHRREGGRTGRQWAVAGLREESASGQDGRRV